jgi:hypothetical protein
MSTLSDPLFQSLMSHQRHLLKQLKAAEEGPEDKFQPIMNAWRVAHHYTRENQRRRGI